MRHPKRARYEGLLLGWLLLGMALFAFLQVVLRYLFHSGFAWGEELNRYLCILLTFAGAALGVERGSHFSMDVLQRILPPGARIWHERITLLLTAIIYGVVAGYGINQVVRLQRFSSHSPALQLPMSGLYLIIPCGCGLMAWRSFRRIFTTASASADQPRKQNDPGKPAATKTEKMPGAER